MHHLVSQNGNIIPAARAKAVAISPVSLYGKGIFTTVAIYHGRPFLWPLHWTRLQEHAQRSTVDISAIQDEELFDSLVKLLGANSVIQGRARITVLSRHIGGPWRDKANETDGAEVLIITGDAREVSDEGITLTVSPYRTNTLSPLVGVKSVNYLDHMIAWEEARERDFDEAVRFNERGEIVSAARANLFWTYKGQLYTPSLTTGALAGTTRAHVLALANQLAIPHLEGVYDLSDLNEADEIFLASAGLGIAPVRTFDYRQYRLAAGSITVMLREALHQSTLNLE